MYYDPGYFCSSWCYGQARCSKRIKEHNRSSLKLKIFQHRLLPCYSSESMQALRYLQREGPPFLRYSLTSNPYEPATLLIEFQQREYRNQKCDNIRVKIPQRLENSRIVFKCTEFEELLQLLGWKGSSAKKSEPSDIFEPFPLSGILNFLQRSRKALYFNLNFQSLVDDVLRIFPLHEMLEKFLFDVEAVCRFMD